MPRFDYLGLEREVQTLLQLDPSMTGVTVTVEKQGLNAVELSPWVNIRLDRRDAPEQYLAGNTRQRYLLRMILTCAQFALDVELAAQLRDDLLGAVEVVLMKNRTISELCSTSWIEGGAFDITSEDAGFVANAEIVLLADISATTT